uniref:Uncharacterized protein n=2 Tax=unclassified Mycobacterium TaxID=2642494 RepID=A0A5Q5BNK8_MYCSS
MSTDQVWGSPGDGRWSLRETAAAIAAAAVIAALGGGAIYAATDEGAGVPGPGSHQPFGPPPGGFGGPGAPPPPQP